MRPAVGCGVGASVGALESVGLGIGIPLGAGVGLGDGCTVGPVGRTDGSGLGAAVGGTLVRGAGGGGRRGR